jgi:aminopeptidase-like protein
MNKNKEELEIIEELFVKLFAICRSITGNGIRKSLKILQEKS